MNRERIEQALREGPPHEPRYVAGSFHRPRNRWSMAVGAALVTVALVIGIVVGLGIGILRNPAGRGAPADPALVARQLIGDWKTAPIAKADWRSRLLALGHNVDDIDAFLIHSPMNVDVVYELTFADGTLTVSESPDGAAFSRDSIGPYQVLDDGRLSWADLGCFVKAPVSFDGDRMMFGTIETSSCGADERIANSAFFNLAPYTRIAAP